MGEHKLSYLLTYLPQSPPPNYWRGQFPLFPLSLRPCKLPYIMKFNSDMQYNNNACNRSDNVNKIMH